MTEIEVKIRDSKHLFSSAERAAAEFLLNDLESVMNMPIADLAERSGVSRATWIRFSKRMGFQGLKDLKRGIVTQISSIAASPERTVNFSDIESFDATGDVCQNIAAISIKSIEDTAKLLNYDILENVADAIINSKRVCVSGMGASGLVAQDLHAKLMRIGIHGIYSMDFHLQLAAVSALEAGDLMLAFSHSGQTSETIELCHLARERGAMLVSITHCGKNAVSDLADLALFTSTPELEKRSGAVGSRIAQLMIVDCIYMVAAKKSYPGAEYKLLNSYVEARKHKKGRG